MSKAKRAKESKLPKKLGITLILLIITIGILLTYINFRPNIETTVASLIGTEVKGYKASDYVKDTFTQNDMKYLPIKIDSTYKTISRSDIEEDFRNAGLNVTGISSNTIGTGTRVETNNGTYTVLMYGDVNGDGEVNVLDAQAIVKHILPNTNYSLSDVSKLAANVEEEKINEINVLDALRIVQFVLNKKPIIDSMPISDLEKDDKAPIITLNGEEEITINVSTKEKPVEYKDAGATAKDNVDFKVNSKIQVTGNVDVNVPGDYILKYNVSDSKGNKAEEVTRTVHVVNYITGIKVATEPTKTDFAKGESISIDGIKAQAIMAYDDGEVHEIPFEELDFSPKTANTTLTTIESQKLAIFYEDFITYTDITVTPHVPIITADSKYPRYVGLGDKSLVLPNVTAVDDEDANISYPVKITVSSKNPDGTTVSTSCTADELTSKINTDTIGVEYTITYTATNTLGNSNSLVQKITVIDVIDRVYINKEMTNKEYIDGDKINLSGLKLVVSMKSTDTKVVEYGMLQAGENILSSTNIAEYTNGTQKIDISYIVEEDPITGEEKTYSAGSIDINVKKKIQSIINVDAGDLTVGQGEIYDSVCVARIKAGPNEEFATLNNINVQITPKDGTAVTSELKKAIWLEEAKDLNGIKIDGQIDIKVAVSEVGKYDITITPNTASTNGYTDGDNPTPMIMEYEAIMESEPTYISLGEFKLKDGTTSQGARFKTGDMLYSDITYKRNYSNEKLNVTNKAVNLNPIYYGDYNILSSALLINSDKELIIGTDIEVKLFNDKYEDSSDGKLVTKVGMRVLKDLDNTASGNRGADINFDLRITDDIGGSHSVRVYNSSKYTLAVRRNF